MGLRISQSPKSGKVQTKQNSSRFLDAFNRIESQLRKIAGQDRRVPFYSLVDIASKSSSAVRLWSTTLREFADLRNAIIHERTDGHVIAEPNDDSVRHIEHIVTMLTKPPTTIPRFQKDVLVLKPGDSVADAATIMLRDSFSQIPICDDRGFVALLSANTLSRWLGSSISTDIFCLSETAIEAVLGFSEDQDNCSFLGRNHTVFDALEKFHSYEREGKRLEAILVTQNGKPTESILGIITVWDMPKIYQMLES